MKLNEIRDNPGARQKRMRIGRGIGSGKGKQGGRGGKGQTARSGVALGGFEGGQMPLYRRLPKRGFSNFFRRAPVAVNLGRIQIAIDKGRLDPSQPVTVEALTKAGIVRRAPDGVSLLAKGELKTKIDVKLTRASKSAIAAVKAKGGSIELERPPAEPKPKPEAKPVPQPEAKPKDAAKGEATKGAKGEGKPPDKPKGEDKGQEKPRGKPGEPKPGPKA
jgi:large subunit ribosomal protein L15